MTVYNKRDKFFIKRERDVTNRRPTFKDIAREAGVSLSTVSLTFSGKGRISKEIREKVLDVADRLGYKRRTYQSAEAGSGGDTLGVLLHMDYEYLWNFFQPTIVEIEAVLFKAGYNLVIIPIELRMHPERVLVKIRRSRAAAVFSLHYADRDLFDKLERMGIPVIILHNCDYQDRFFSVAFDDLQGAYEATTYLIKLGHRRIAYVEFVHQDLFAIKNDRFFGFKKAIDEFGLPFDQGMRVAIDYPNMEETDQRLSAVFRKKEPPTAIFIHDDYLALRVVKALNRMNLRIPEDVSIIAPGDVLVYTEPHVPAITTMRINTALIGKLASEMMLNRLHNKPDDIHVLRVKEQLVDRGSCRAITGENT
jgi:DNA-binding LacI/PurR family transcriptional regulator